MKLSCSAHLDMVWNRGSGGGTKLLIVLLSLARVRLSGTSYKMVSQGVVSADTEGVAGQCWGKGTQSR